MSATAQDRMRDPDEGEQPMQLFWQWFALVVLALCWIAEGALCGVCGP